MHRQHWMTWAMCAALAATGGCGEDDTGAAPGPGSSAAGSGAAGDGNAAGAGPATSNDDPSSGATETNAVPVACESSAACPTGIECVLPPGGGVGFCNVSETDAAPGGEGDEPPNEGGDPITPVEGPSLGTPAPCGSDDDCPAGIGCTLPEEGGLGFCNVNEMQGG